MAALTLDWLLEHGYGDMARQAVVVMNYVGGSAGEEAVADGFVLEAAPHRD